MKKLFHLLISLISLSSFAQEIPHSDWMPCLNKDPRCRQRTLGDYYEFGGKTIKAIPGEIEEFYEGRTSSYVKVWLRPSEDFHMTTNNGEKITFIKEQRCPIFSGGFIRADLKYDVTLKLKGVNFHVKAMKYPTIHNSIQIFSNGQIHEIPIEQHHNKIIEIAGQKTEIGLLLLLHKNGAVEWTRVYSDLRFTLPNGERYLFPGKQYRGGLISLTEQEMPDFSGQFGEMYIREN